MSVYSQKMKDSNDMNKTSLYNNIFGLKKIFDLLHIITYFYIEKTGFNKIILAVK